jgi:hypothetical protein
MNSDLTTYLVRNTGSSLFYVKYMRIDNLYDIDCKLDSIY